MGQILLIISHLLQICKKYITSFKIVILKNLFYENKFILNKLHTYICSLLRMNFIYIEKIARI